MCTRSAYTRAPVETFVWSGEDAARIEIARVEIASANLRAEGTQVGVA